jgi:uncharacterized membrane protein
MIACLFFFCHECSLEENVDIVNFGCYSDVDIVNIYLLEMILMAQLFMLFLIVIGTYSGLTLLNAVVPNVNLSRSLRGRISLAFLFVFTGVSHFLMPEEMAQMLPAFVPFRIEIIYLTGILEIAGAIGLLIPGLEKIASIALILFLLTVLPANVYAAVNYVEFGAHALGPIYLLARVPFQLFLIGWTYYFGIKHDRQQNQPIGQQP